jgi:Rab5 GDP/GTP exchange factor
MLKKSIMVLISHVVPNSTFTPHVATSIPPRPVTSDDLERDRILTQRIALFGWIEEKHLDVPEGEGSGGFMMFAQQGDSSSACPWRPSSSCFSLELLKINHYKAPRDKLICILNCCKVIFGSPYFARTPCCTNPHLRLSGLASMFATASILYCR